MRLLVTSRLFERVILAYGLQYYQGIFEKQKEGNSNKKAGNSKDKKKTKDQSADFTITQAWGFLAEGAEAGAGDGDEKEGVGGNLEIAV
jgi:hypothetical protein